MDAYDFAVTRIFFDLFFEEKISALDLFTFEGMMLRKEGFNLTLN